MRVLGVKRFFGFKGGDNLHFVHAEDAARAIVFLLDSKQAYGNCYNIAEPEAISSGEFLTEVFKAFNFKLEGIVSFPGVMLKIWGFVMFYMLWPFLVVFNFLYKLIWKKLSYSNHIVNVFVPKIDKEYYRFYFGGTRELDPSALMRLGFEFKYLSIKQELKNIVKWYSEKKWIPDFEK